MNIAEGYERLAGCILAKTAEQFYAAYGGHNAPDGISPEERTLWLWVSGQATIGTHRMIKRRLQGDRIRRHKWT